MKINVPNRVPTILTHEGSPAVRINAEQQLRRVVMASMLWEDQFYIDGKLNAEIIKEAAANASPQTVAEIAIEAREKQKLRHVPLLLVRELARRKDLPPGLVASTLERVIQRADELTEFLAIYWKDGKVPLSAQVKKGLARAFQKFDAYQLAKYNRDGAIKLRDVMFMVHPQPRGVEQAVTLAKLAEGALESPDTWEVAISGAKKDQKNVEWARLLAEKKLGAMALLRNLRNLKQAHVPDAEIRQALAEMKADRVLPFRFIAAARAVPALEDALEPAMMKGLEGAEFLLGTTVILVDVSGSMGALISAKSDMTRMDAACGVAMILREVCAMVGIVSFSGRAEVIPPRRGFALRDAIVGSQPHSSTYLGAAVKAVNAETKYDRIIVITDEQSADTTPNPLPGSKGYVINVAAYKNGVGYRAWTHIDGWSEAVVDFIRETEKVENE